LRSAGASSPETRQNPREHLYARWSGKLRTPRGLLALYGPGIIMLAVLIGWVVLFHPRLESRGWVLPRGYIPGPGEDAAGVTRDILVAFLVAFALVRIWLILFPAVIASADFEKSRWSAEYAAKPRAIGIITAILRLSWWYTILPMVVMSLIETGAVLQVTGPRLFGEHAARPMVQGLIIGGAAVLVVQGFLLVPISYVGGVLRGRVGAARWAIAPTLVAVLLGIRQIGWMPLTSDVEPYSLLLISAWYLLPESCIGMLAGVWRYTSPLPQVLLELGVFGLPCIAAWVVLCRLVARLTWSGRPYEVPSDAAVGLLKVWKNAVMKDGKWVRLYLYPGVILLAILAIRYYSTDQYGSDRGSMTGNYLTVLFTLARSYLVLITVWFLMPRLGNSSSALSTKMRMAPDDVMWATKWLIWLFAVLPLLILSLLETVVMLRITGAHALSGLWMLRMGDEVIYWLLYYSYCGFCLLVLGWLLAGLIFIAGLVRGHRGAILVAGMPVAGAVVGLLSGLDSVYAKRVLVWILAPEFGLVDAKWQPSDLIAPLLVFSVLTLGVWLIVQLLVFGRLSPGGASSAGMGEGTIAGVPEVSPGPGDRSIALRSGPAGFRTLVQSTPWIALLARWNGEVLIKLARNPVAWLMAALVCILMKLMADSPHGLPIVFMGVGNRNAIIGLLLLTRVWLAALPAMVATTDIRPENSDGASEARPAPRDAIRAMSVLAWFYGVIPAVLLILLETAFRYGASWTGILVKSAFFPDTNLMMPIYIEHAAFAIPLALLMTALAYLGALARRGWPPPVAGSLIGALAPAALIALLGIPSLHSPFFMVARYMDGAVPTFGSLDVGGHLLGVATPLGVFIVLALVAWVFLGRRLRKELG